MWLRVRCRLHELVNHVECDVRDNLGNPSVAVARFAGVTELRIGNVNAPVSSGGRLLQRLGCPQVQKLTVWDLYEGHTKIWMRLRGIFRSAGRDAL